jgi:SAM-dependent methyltransferase
VGERLPFRDGSFDGVVCCLVIEHTVDPDAVLAEAVRVLAVGGRFILLVNHPLFQGTGSGFVDDQILGEHYWRVGPYLREDVALEEVDPGVQLRFAHRPLSRYVNPVVALGCVLTRLEEPEPPLEFLEGSIDLELESAIPRLLLLRFERLSVRQMGR